MLVAFSDGELKYLLRVLLRRARDGRVSLLLNREIKPHRGEDKDREE
jgi:hypothetical protein